MSRELQVVLNINTGVMVPRTPATDENPVIFRRIDMETCKAISGGKVKASDIIEALEKRERSAPDFNWREYDKKRRAAEKLLNVSRREMIPVSEDQGETVKDDGNANVISLKDIMPEGSGEEKQSEEKPKARGRKPVEKTVEDNAAATAETTGGLNL